jgi:hypothetical protein
MIPLHDVLRAGPLAESTPGCCPEPRSVLRVGKVRRDRLHRACGFPCRRDQLDCSCSAPHKMRDLTHYAYFGAICQILWPSGVRPLRPTIVAIFGSFCYKSPSPSGLYFITACEVDVKLLFTITERRRAMDNLYDDISRYKNTF